MEDYGAEGMALIDCSECGRQISDQARECPGCGAPLAGLQAKADRGYLTPTGKFALVAMVAVAAVAALSVAVHREPEFTGKLRAEPGSEFALLDEPSPIGGQCTGWKAVSFQKTNDAASGIKSAICWRETNGKIETNSVDGEGRRTDPKSRYRD
ncbi:zinc ribbon domain-containing protein [Stenotrophomonas sp.]|uniref:zinc ribbon domain-containing protein n=1 Tax=Stenotrophomonas sp. TaxID=69392 RepID=UPI0028B1B797|nr:zinc ribbon domain-containing protein [Stenotrophomonas sp.]